MAQSDDQIEKDTLVLRLSVSIFNMNDDQIRRLLAVMEQPQGTVSGDMNGLIANPVACKDPAINRHLMIARLFVSIKQLDKDSLLERLKRYNHPDFKWVREFPRMNCYLLVDFAAGGKAYRGYIRDISAGGVFIETSELFEKNQELALCFTMAEPRADLPFKIKGKVIGVYPDGIGVRYDSITRQQREIIDTLIKSP